MQNYRLEALIIGTLGSLLASLVLYGIGIIDFRSLVDISLCIILVAFAHKYYYIKSHIGFRNIWVPTSSKPLNYRIDEATYDYIAMGVTLHSLLEKTGIGIDLEGFAARMPKALMVRLLILHPDSPFFQERVIAARPNAHNIDEITRFKKEQVKEIADKSQWYLQHNVDIRFYSTHPTWWIQMVDKKRIYFSTQTRDSYIGQSYPFAMQFDKQDDSYMFWSLSTMLESLWIHSLPIRSDGSIPLLEQEDLTYP